MRCITTTCADIFSQDDVRCLQMFQRCFQMFSAVFRCSQLFSDVLRMPSIDHRYSLEILRYVPIQKSTVIRPSPMIWLDYRSFTTIDQEILMTLPPLFIPPFSIFRSSLEVVWTSSESFSPSLRPLIFLPFCLFVFLS